MNFNTSSNRFDSILVLIVSMSCEIHYYCHSLLPLFGRERVCVGVGVGDGVDSAVVFIAENCNRNFVVKSVENC